MNWKEEKLQQEHMNKPRFQSQLQRQNSVCKIRQKGHQGKKKKHVFYTKERYPRGEMEKKK